MSDNIYQWLLTSILQRCLGQGVLSQRGREDGTLGSLSVSRGSSLLGIT